jgi:hypothetical protein
VDDVLHLVGSSADVASTGVGRGKSATPPVGASLMANIRFARALGWTSRRLDRQIGAGRPFLLGGARGSASGAARHTPRR